MKSIIVEDSSVEEAVQNALKKLEVSREQVEVDVLEEGSRGIFWIYRRQAGKGKGHTKGNT
jgi:spoIIIJ-associated protein